MKKAEEKRSGCGSGRKIVIKVQLTTAEEEAARLVNFNLYAEREQ